MAPAPVTRVERRDDRSDERRAMLRRVDDVIAETVSETGVRKLDPALRAALERVPRHRFVPEKNRDRAYADAPLPIGAGQTISQPFIVALMTQLAGVSSSSVVLEIGTGSGYQAALLGELARQVYSIEIVPELAERAASCLARLGYANVEVRCGDGYGGWEEHAPFDVILLTAASPAVPPPLVAQLASGGRMVLPVGNPGETQELLLLRKCADGTIETVQELPVAFVPLTRGAA